MNFQHVFHLDVSDLNLIRLAARQVVQLTLALGVVGLATHLLCRRRAHWAYALWMVVLVKAVTPPLWSSATGVFSWAELHHDRVVAMWPGREQVAAMSSMPMAPSPVAAWPRVGENYSSDVAARPAALAGGLDWLRVAAGVWAAGCGAMLLTVAGRSWAVRRRIRASSVAASGDVVEIVESLRQTLGIRRRVGVWICREPVGPAAMGILRPALVMPAAMVQSYGRSRLRGALAHEMVHLRRGDPPAAALQLLVGAVWWFNPLVWWMNRRIDQVREMCVDAEVVAGLQCPAEDYAQMLIDTVRWRRGFRPMPMALGIRPVQVTAQRLRHIMSGGVGVQRRLHVWRWVVAGVLGLALLPGAGIGLTTTMAVSGAGDAQGAAQGSGVLEFHILADANTANPADLLAMGSRMTPGGAGPAAQAGDTIRWMEVYHQEEFNRPGGKREAPEWKGKYYVPVLVTREGTMDQSSGKWGLKRAVPIQGQGNGTAIGFTFDDKGGDLFAKLTTYWYKQMKARTDVKNGHARLAIVVDGKIISAPNILVPIVGGGGVITGGGEGGFKPAEVDFLLKALNAGIVEKMPPAATQPTTAPEADGDGRARHFIAIVVDVDGITFQGDRTTVDRLPDLLGVVTDRADTVLELSVASGDVKMGQFEKVAIECGRVAQNLGFKYLGFSGTNVSSAASSAMVRKMVDEYFEYIESARRHAASSTGSNKALSDFLGQPVAPPGDLNQAYGKGGLTKAMRLAADAAGITLGKIEIDDSEFPFLVGVECEKGDWGKLGDAIKKMPEYSYGGSVSDNQYAAMNITPYRVFPRKDVGRIDRRLGSRMQMLYYKIIAGAAGGDQAMPEPPGNLPALAPHAAFSALTYVVRFQTGQSSFIGRDRITITEVRGTSDTFDVGGTYQVKGTYHLASHDKAQLGLYVTAIRPEDGWGKVAADQTMDIVRGDGEFTLIERKRCEGYFHVSIYADGDGIGGVYFGTGDSVLH